MSGRERNKQPQMTPFLLQLFVWPIHRKLIIGFKNLLLLRIRLSLSHGVRARSCHAMVRLQEIFSVILTVQSNCLA